MYGEGRLGASLNIPRFANVVVGIVMSDSDLFLILSVFLLIPADYEEDYEKHCSCERHRDRRARLQERMPGIAAGTACALLNPAKEFLMRPGILISILAIAICAPTHGAVTLPMRTVFKGQDRFEQLVVRAKAETWKTLPIGERTAVVGQAMVGTPYRSFTLEIDNRVESPSVNFMGLDCWTFFETALAFARMLDEPETDWTPAQLLRYIEIDRYRHAECTGEYLSRLHYLEDWLYDNDRRGLVEDLTRSLGGVSVPHSAREMTNGWRHYRYLVQNRRLLRPLAEMESEVSSRPLYEIPKRRVAAIESRLRSGDIIGIVSRDGRYTFLRATSHVGLALRAADGTIHFMHASAPHNYGRVVIDTRLSNYLYRYSADTGILVARPLR